MRILLALLLMISLHVTIAFAQSHREEPDPEPKSFKEAYAGYNEATKDNKLHLTTHYAQHAYEFGQKKFGLEHTNTLALTINWINAYINHNFEHDDPREIGTKALPIFRDSAKGNPISLLDTYLAYGSYYLIGMKKSDTNKAINFFDAAIKITEDVYKNDKTSIAVIKLEIARKLYRDASATRVMRHLKEAKDIFSIAPGKNKTNLAITNFWIAKLYLSTRKNRKAAKVMSLAINTFDEIEPNGDYAMMGHAFMIKILEGQGKRDEATKHCQKIGEAQAFDVNAEPKPLFRLQPIYPKTRAEGYTIIEFTIDAEGYVTNAKPIAEEGSEKFSRAALDVIKNFRYAPRYEDGQPVATDGMKTRFTFKKQKR